MLGGNDIERRSSRSEALECVRPFGHLRWMVWRRVRLAARPHRKSSKQPTKSTPAPRPALRSCGAGGDFFSLKLCRDRPHVSRWCGAGAVPFLSQSHPGALRNRCLRSSILTHARTSEADLWDRDGPSDRGLPAGDVTSSRPVGGFSRALLGLRSLTASRRMGDSAKPNKSTPVPRSFLRLYGTGEDLFVPLAAVPERTCSSIGRHEELNQHV